MNILTAKAHARLATAERRAANHLNDLAYVSTALREGRAYGLDCESTTDVCARVREARADLAEAQRGGPR